MSGPLIPSSAAVAPTACECCSSSTALCACHCRNLLDARHVRSLVVNLAHSARCSGILKRWVSRFDVWPYLETFTIDVAHELRAALGAKVSPLQNNPTCASWSTCGCILLSTNFARWVVSCGSTCALPAQLSAGVGRMFALNANVSGGNFNF